MRLWITRPERDAAVLRAQLVAHGHEVIVEPLLLIDFEDADPIELDDVQALIATSRNGVRAVCETPNAEAARALPLFAVGPGTASTAAALGFTNIIKGPSTAAQLLPAITERADVNGGALLHLAGGHLAFDLANELRQFGYHILQPTVYIARAARQLSTRLLQRLANGEIDGVILLSPRTAQTYVNLIFAHQAEQTARGLAHYCLSPNVAAPLGQLRLEVVKISRQPRIGELLALMDQTAEQCE